VYMQHAHHFSVPATCIPLPFPQSDLHCQQFFFNCLHSYPFDTTLSQNILKICPVHLLINIHGSLVILFVTFQWFAPIQKNRLDITSKNSQLCCNIDIYLDFHTW
jgi:hypothetical protein